jgi:hypothetical protein
MTVVVFSNQNDVGASAGEHQQPIAHGGSLNDRIGGGVRVNIIPSSFDFVRANR